MTERGFPEQRNRYSGTPESVAEQLRADAVADLDRVVLDEAFIRAAPVQEQSAHARLLEAHWSRQPASSGPWRTQQPDLRWSVRPAHHLAAMRLSALLWFSGAVTGATVLIGLLARR